jgi:methionyl-tRNA synthetase
VKLIERANQGVVPQADPLRRLPPPPDLRPDLALAEIFALVEEANRFVETKAPWKSTGEEQRATLATLAATIREAAAALAPYLPKTAAAIDERIGAHTQRVAPGAPLFPKTAL